MAKRNTLDRLPATARARLETSTSPFTADGLPPGRRGGADDRVWFDGRLSGEAAEWLLVSLPEGHYPRQLRGAGQHAHPAGGPGPSPIGFDA
jgi:hypothetical protein